MRYLLIVLFAAALLLSGCSQQVTAPAEIETAAAPQQIEVYVYDDCVTEVVARFSADSIQTMWLIPGQEPEAQIAGELFWRCVRDGWDYCHARYSNDPEELAQCLRMKLAGCKIGAAIIWIATCWWPSEL